MRTASIGKAGLIQFLLSSINSWIESEYNLRDARKNAEMKIESCNEKEKITKTALKVHKKSIGKTFKLIRKELDSIANRQKHLNLLLEDINEHILKAENTGELSKCLLIQKSLSIIINKELTESTKMIRVELEKINQESLKKIIGG